MGVRIVSLSTTTPASVPASLVPVSQTGITFRAALASLSEKANAESGSMQRDTEPDSDAGTATSKQETKQPSSSVNDTGVLATSTLPPTLPTTVWAANQSSRQTSGNRPVVNDAGVLATSTLPPVIPTTAWAANQSSRQTSGNRPVVNDAGVLATSTLPPSIPTTAWAANQSSRQTSGNRPVVNDAGVLATSTLPPTLPTTVWAANQSSRQTSGNLPSVNDAGVLATSTLPPAAFVVTKGSYRNATRDWTDARIAPQSATTPASVPATPSLVSPTDTAFRAALTSLSRQANTGSSPIQRDTELNSGAGTATSKQETKQPSSSVSDADTRATLTLPPVNQPAKTWAASKSSVQTTGNRPIVSDANTFTTATLPPVNQPAKTWAASKPSVQTNSNHPVVSDTGVRTTAPASPASVVVANGSYRNATLAQTNERIASISTTKPSSSPAVPVPVSLSSIPSQAAPANSPRHANAKNGSMAGSSQTHSNAAAASRIVSQQETVQLSSVNSDANALTTVPVVSADQPAAWTADSSSQPTNRNSPSDGSSVTSAPAMDVPAPTAHDLPLQLLASQLAADPAEPAAAPLKPMNPTLHSDGSVATELPGSAPATPSGTPQAGVGIAAPVAAEIVTAPMELPTASALPSNGDWTQPAGKAVAKQTNDAAVTKNPGLGSATEPGKSKYAEAGSTGSDGSLHSAQNSGQPAQHAQTAPSQVAAVTPKVADSGASQAQTLVMHAVSHQAAPALRTAGGPEDASRQGLPQGDPTSNESDSGDGAATTGINAAKLIQTMGQTGMNVAMRSNEFGNISIHTSVSQQQMLAQISLDHGDLSQALASHVSSVQTKLENESGLHTVIEVNHQGASSSGDSGNSPQREQNAFVRSARTGNVALPAEPDIVMSPAALVTPNNSSRLDIRA